MKKIGSNNLSRNRDGKFITKALNRAKMEELEILVWKSLKNDRLTANVHIRTIRKSKSEFEIYPSRADQHLLETILNNSIFLNIYIAELAIMFKAEIIKRGKNITLKIPSIVAQVERRKHLRLLLTDDEHLSVRANLYKRHSSALANKVQYFEKGCFDISAGGISFLTTKDESSFFAVGDIIDEMTIVLTGKVISVVSKVVATIPVKPTPQNKLYFSGYKICLQFQEIAPEQRKNIDNFVFRHIPLEKLAS